MKRLKRFVCSVAAIACLAPAARSSTLFGVTTLVTDATDSDLVNPWGMSYGPTPFWVSNNMTGTSTLYSVDPAGPSCHTGATSCFFRAHDGEGGGIKIDDGPPDPPAVIVARVADVIARRRKERPEKSYVVSLLDKGFEKINAKISEEAGELVEALPQADAAHTAHEAADLLFHMLVGLEAAGVPAERVFAELGRRFGVSGIAEKASRKK